MRARDHLYVVAAALIAPAQTAEAIEVLRTVPAGRSPRFHWRNEREPTRLRMLEAIRDLGLVSIATCYLADRARWGERGRVKSLGRLLWELRELGVAEMILERRNEADDAKDRKLIARAQRRQEAPAAMTYRFERPYDHPLLWVPDAVAGAVAHSFADGVDRYLDHLGVARPTIIDVGLF